MIKKDLKTENLMKPIFYMKNTALEEVGELREFDNKTRTALVFFSDGITYICSYEDLSLWN